jgi:peptidoglycan/LPS O-acetylase OafA/YrhL
LRGISVAMVVIFHASDGRLLPGGSVGVDIFFVLSGYLITSLLMAEHCQNGKISLRRFYARRMLRLTPALWAMLLGTISAWWLTYQSAPQWTAVSAAAFYYMNWLRAFSTGQGWILGHTWSLAVEEQFYLLWPAVLVIAVAIRPSIARWAAALLLVSSIMAWIIVWPAALSLEEVNRVYNGFDTRSAELFIGCLLALLPISKNMARRARQYSSFPIVLIALAALTLDWNSPILIFGGYHVIALSAAWILIAINAGAPFNSVLRRPILVYTGRISYGLYLFHYPIAQLLIHRGWNTAFTILVVASLSFLLAVLSYQLIERHVLRYAAKHFSAFDSQASTEPRQETSSLSPEVIGAAAVLTPVAESPFSQPNSGSFFRGPGLR